MEADEYLPDENGFLPMDVVDNQLKDCHRYKFESLDVSSIDYLNEMAW